MLSDLFSTEQAQGRERRRLFGIIEDLVKWENTNNEEVLQRARGESWQSWRWACAENADHRRAKELFEAADQPGTICPCQPAKELFEAADQPGTICPCQPAVVQASSLPASATSHEPTGGTSPPRFEGMAARTAPLRSRGFLPHLFKPGATYFVTFRLADAIRPPAGPLPSGAEPEDIARDAEPPLQQGSCALADPRAAELVQNALRHFDGERYQLHSWCVMPNHVHVVVTPYGEHVLSGILHSWKSFTANQLNRLLGRAGAFWESESFDHLIRNERSYFKFCVYTEYNPVAAGLCPQPADWPFSSAYAPSRLEACTTDLSEPAE